MIHIVNPADCCGCTACASVCTHDAITMHPDALGFLYPAVDKEKCVDCGLCEKVCAFSDQYDTFFNLAQPDAYAARHKDMKEIEASRSGAAFIAISDWILARGGVVYGAGYTDHFRVTHKRATTIAERDEFRGSKYVQSDMGNVFNNVKDDLNNGMIVLFSGTPCQTSGLNSYIGKKLRDNLYLVDIVCHGVPAPYIWRDYLTYLEKKYSSKICMVNFRDKKKFGWMAHKETYKFDKGKVYAETGYTFLFEHHIALRLSCGNCHFANTRRPSDITLADFWGWEKTCPNFNTDNKGCSLVLVNTKKGRCLFESAAKDLDIIPAKLEDCMQNRLRAPSALHPQRMAFEDEYKKRGFEYVYKKYGEENLRIRISRYIWRIKGFLSIS